MQLRKRYFSLVALVVTFISLLLGVTTNSATAITISPTKVVSNDREYVLIVRKRKNNRVLFYCYKKHGYINSNARLVILLPNGRKHIGTKIYRNRAIYSIIHITPGNYRVKLYDGRKTLLFPTIRISGPTNNQQNITEEARVLSVKCPPLIDVGKSDKTPFRVIAKTNTATTRLVIRGNSTHTFRLIKNSRTYKIWEWKHTFYPGEVSPQKSYTKIMTIIPYNRQNKKGKHRFISFRIKNSRKSYKNELIDKFIAKIRSDVGKKYAECNGKSGRLCGQCKHYLQTRLKQIAEANNYVCKNGKIVNMPPNHPPGEYDSPEYGICWEDEGCAFNTVTEFRATGNHKYNKEQIKELLRTVQRGDILQMRWKLGNKYYPHTLIFTSTLRGNKIEVCDSNRKPAGGRKVSCDYLSVDYFIKALDCKNCGATLYRLRDDIKKGS
jgi:hypothetical protein